MLNGVPLENLARQKLNDLARREKRRPQEQAAILLEIALGIRHAEPATILRLQDYQSRKDKESL